MRPMQSTGIICVVPLPPPLMSWDTNDLITPFSAAILGLSLTESGYAAEMIRAGIQAVSAGQAEAAASLGMTRWQSLRRIIMPGAAHPHPADRQRHHLDAEIHLAGQRAGAAGPDVLGADDLLADLPDDPAAARRHGLVPRARDDPHRPRASRRAAHVLWREGGGRRPAIAVEARAR